MKADACQASAGAHAVGMRRLTEPMRNRAAMVEPHG
jgi:hypothetical protein